MKAYTLECADKKKIWVVDHGYSYHMPNVECPRCSSWGHWAVEYPAVDFELLNSEEHLLGRVVSLAELQNIKEKIFTAARRRFNLVPGGCLGTPSGKAMAATLDDFAWGRIVPLVSKRAVELLAKEGIQLRTGKVDLQFRGRKIDSHVSLQVEPFPVLTNQSRHEFTIEHCQICDDYRQVNLKPHVPHGYRIDRTKVPADDLFKSMERMCIIASPRFIDAARKHSLSGIAFIECGEYV